MSTKFHCDRCDRVITDDIAPLKEPVLLTVEGWPVSIMIGTNKSVVPGSSADSGRILCKSCSYTLIYKAATERINVNEVIPEREEIR